MFLAISWETFQSRFVEQCGVKLHEISTVTATRSPGSFVATTTNSPTTMPPHVHYEIVGFAEHLIDDPPPTNPPTATISTADNSDNYNNNDDDDDVEVTVNLLAQLP